MTQLLNQRQPIPDLFTIKRKGTGTKQWSGESYNICEGCSHNCAYCYAQNINHRFNGGKGNWATMVVDPKKVAAAAKKFSDVVMFPSSHDITPAILPNCLVALHNLLSHGNHVLIVSKPHLDVIKVLCKELANYKKQILFRFTIGSSVAATCQLWEPGAPPPKERIAALKHAYDAGYHTSVSMEPMLGDIAEMIQLVNSVDPYVSDTIWLGIMNGIVIYKNKSVQWGAQIRTAKTALKNAHSDANIMKMVNTLSGNPKVKWKNSILDVIAKANGTASAPGPAKKPKDPARIAAAQKAWITIRKNQQNGIPPKKQNNLTKIGNTAKPGPTLVDDDPEDEEIHELLVMIAAELFVKKDFASVKSETTLTGKLHNWNYTITISID